MLLMRVSHVLRAQRLQMLYVHNFLRALMLMAMHAGYIHGHHSQDSSGESFIHTGSAENHDRTHALSHLHVVSGRPILPLSPLTHGHAPRR